MTDWERQRKRAMWFKQPRMFIIGILLRSARWLSSGPGWSEYDRAGRVGMETMYWAEFWRAERRIEVLKEALAAASDNVDLAEECGDLRRKVKKLKHELTKQRENNYKRNLELDALHYVWCDGGCIGGVHRYGNHPPLTRDIVEAAHRNTVRLTQWYCNRNDVDLKSPIWLRIFSLLANDYAYDKAPKYWRKEAAAILDALLEPKENYQ